MGTCVILQKIFFPSPPFTTYQCHTFQQRYANEPLDCQLGGLRGGKGGSRKKNVTVPEICGEAAINGCCQLCFSEALIGK